ncbi:chemotaxis protein CheW [Viridibacterium curvum]
MTQFYQVFFEESQEHLAAMESLLVAIDPAEPDSEDLNAIFRAAHSIKGSSATFGFSDLAEVTHVMENLLDRVRKNELPLTDSIVDACLKAGDVLRNLLGAHQGLETADHAAAEVVRERLEALMKGDGVSAAEPGDAEQADVGFIISFKLQCKADEHPRVLENLLVELRQHGRLVLEEAGSGGRHGKATRLRLCTEHDEISLRALLDFVVGSSLKMEGVKGKVGSLVQEEAYGFFDDVPAPSSDALEDPDGAYGLFELTPAMIPANAEPVGMEAEDGSFGLFDVSGLPAAEPDKPAASVHTDESAKRTMLSPDAGKAATAPRAAPGGESGSIRVSVDKVDQMINLVGELVITQAMLAQAASKVDPVVFESLLNSLGHLERNTRDLQESVMSVRMLPISTVFSRFPRVVRDLSQKLGKKVQLVMSGEHTELDKTLIERITDPLTHLIRNSLDHGIESPDKRVAAGKVEQGTVTLRAYHQSGNIVIEVGDDGGGLNRDKILGKARERGLIVHDNMSDQEVWMLIFEPGFSTADVVTDVSGRGVGMDVVRKNINALNGRIEIDSVLGVGTRVTVRLPLTLAILDGMSVGVGEEVYIIPLDYVVESLQPAESMLKSLAGAERVLQVRGEYLPLISLRHIFGVPGNDPPHASGIVIVVECDGMKAALFVEQILGQQQVVIKSLEANYRRVVGIAGATIMGDGHVALIVDASAVVSMARHSLPVAA